VLFRSYYLVRSVDPLDVPLAVPERDYILAGGPFDEADETQLLHDHAIDCVVTKNSGGAATYAKIAAARALGLDVIVVERKPELGVPTVADVDQALAHIDHVLPPA
jgi:precorrin-6A/cobalt-precorrin-6A reductase